MDQICSEALRQQETEIRKLPAAEADADRFVSPTNPTRRLATSSVAPTVTSPAPTAQAPTTTGRPVAAAVGPKAATKQVRSAFPG
jgi:hypothetical protein